MTDTRLEILHDHYKDSFSYIREREKERERLLLVLIALFVVLAFQIQYATDFLSALSAITILGVKANLSTLPLPALLAATWVFVLAVTLRYCQTSINVERQYDYLHMLEEKISSELGDAELYRREGEAYTRKYPIFSWWAWGFYVILLPIITATVTFTLVYRELTQLEHPLLSQVIDLVVASGVIISFVLYRVPTVWRKAKRLWERCKTTQETSDE